MATDWRWLNLEEAEVGLLAADVVAVRRWWLEERWLVLVCRLVKMAAACQSAGSSALRVCFQRSLKFLICCVGFLSPVAEASDGGLKCFIGVKVNTSGLEGPACWSSTTMKEVSLLTFYSHQMRTHKLQRDLIFIKRQICPARMLPHTECDLIVIVAFILNRTST